MGTGLRPVTPRYYSPPLLSPHYCVGRKKFAQKDGQIFVSRRGGTLENMKVNVKTSTSTSKHGMSTIRRGVGVGAELVYLGEAKIFSPYGATPFTHGLPNP
jgi:hypothetical protein